MNRFEHQVAAVEPLTMTMYAKDGRVLMRSMGLRQGMRVDVPKDIRKRVARTETFDARGVVVDQWEAPWETET